MPMELDRFCQRWPFLYHATDRRNLGSIATLRELLSAHRLAPRMTFARPRREAVQVTGAGGAVYLCDQAGLRKGHIEFQAGWTFEDLLRALSQRVFFWVGREVGPREHGVRHFDRYRASHIVMRVPTSDLLRSAHFELCQFNSGSPRTSEGRKSPRGPSTFLPSDRFDLPASHAVEVTLIGSVHLPASAKWSRELSGPWRSLDAMANEPGTRSLGDPANKPQEASVEILERVRESAARKLLFLPHALRQMSRPERMISVEDVRRVVTNGELIEDYPDDPRGHSCLLLATIGERRLHVCCAPKGDYLAVITAYAPDPNQWGDGFRKRTK